MDKDKDEDEKINIKIPVTSNCYSLQLLKKFTLNQIFRYRDFFYEYSWKQFKRLYCNIAQLSDFNIKGGHNDEYYWN